jgi:putative transposase
MTPATDTTRYKNHRFPGEIISHGVWLYYRFTLSYRDVQELLFERGITVSHEAIRQWCRKFGQDYANQLRHRRPRPGDKWHLEMCQTQPIKMSWCPLRLLRQMPSNLRG